MQTRLKKEDLQNGKGWQMYADCAGKKAHFAPNSERCISILAVQEYTSVLNSIQLRKEGNKQLKLRTTTESTRTHLSRT